jgi:hypothetical protein
MKRLTCLTLVLLARSAGAQPGLEDPPPPPARPTPPEFVDRVYVTGGLLLTVDHFLNAAWLLDGGVRLSDLPIAIHANAATGGSLDADNGGDFWRVMAGVELRSSTGAAGYAFLDMDLGYQHQTWSDDPSEHEVHRGPLAGARIGYDAGGEHIRVRATFELYKYHREFVNEMTTWDSGGGFTLAAGYRF